MLVRGSALVELRTHVIDTITGLCIHKGQLFRSQMAR